MTGLLIFTGLVLAVIPACVWWDRRNRYHSDAPLVVGGIAGIVGLVAVIACFAIWGEFRSCDQKGDALGRDSQYGIFTGCLVATDDGQMVPLDNLRFNERGEVAR